MNFIEQKKEEGYEYKTETWHGKFIFRSEERIDPEVEGTPYVEKIKKRWILEKDNGKTDKEFGDYYRMKILDSIYMAVIQSGTEKGSVKDYGKGKITWEWEKSDQWLGDEDAGGVCYNKLSNTERIKIALKPVKRFYLKIKAWFIRNIHG